LTYAEETSLALIRPTKGKSIIGSNDVTAIGSDSVIQNIATINTT